VRFGAHTDMDARRLTPADRPRIERAAEHYLQSCYQKRTAVRVDEFAAVLGVTPQHLGRVLPAIIGTSIRNFLRRRQLQRAAALLESTPLSTTDVALGSGFGTRSTFFRCFQAAFGQTPTEYREQVPKRDSETLPSKLAF
jgi:AraC family transcriptional regulator